jgi:ankyrin repeat protein
MQTRNLGHLRAALALHAGPDTHGTSAVHVAAALRWPEAVAVIAQAGAAVDSPDATGLTALCYAASYDDAETVAALLAAGANPRTAGPGGQRPLALCTPGGAVWALLAPLG